MIFHKDYEFMKNVMSEFLWIYLLWRNLVGIYSRLINRDFQGKSSLRFHVCFIVTIHELLVAKGNSQFALEILMEFYFEKLEDLIFNYFEFCFKDFEIVYDYIYSVANRRFWRFWSLSSIPYDLHGPINC